MSATDRLGAFSADLTFNLESEQSDGDEKSSYANAHLGLRYTSAEFYGLSFGSSLQSGRAIWEKNKDDAEETENTLLSELYMRYDSEHVILQVGRQHIERQWIEDFHEAITFSIQPVEWFEIRGGYSRRLALVDMDEIGDFEDIGNSGAYFSDIVILYGEDELEINPYLIHTPDLYTGYGVAIEVPLYEALTAAMVFGGTNQMHRSEENGSIFHLNLDWEHEDVVVTAGSIHTGENGIGSLDFLGEKLNPLEEGDLVFAADATTFYASAEYNLSPFGLAVILGLSDSAEADETEINLLISYNLEHLWPGFSLECVYSSIQSGVEEGDYSILTLSIQFLLGEH